MTPETFIAHWANNPLTERAGAQQHFNDLCELLGVDKPRDPENYCFERGAKKSGGGDGWADVWKRGHFGWENKKPGRDLNAALKQLTDYALQLESPPLLVVCDRERIIIHTAFTGYPDEAREIRIEELADPAKLQTLRWIFTDPEKLRPEKSTAAITAEAAGQFSSLAKAMRERGLESQRVAHFLVQCLFCMFAEDEALLPGNVFTEILKNAGTDTDRAVRRIGKIFAAMQQKSGGEYGDHDIAWFNGGLFSTIDVPELAVSDLDVLHRAAADMDWRGIDPTIFGTLFERGLDPAARAPLGAHYTDTATIAKLIAPLITEPLLAEWASVKTLIAAGGVKKSRVAWQGFLLRLNQFKVLDPACGSGNFLYLALKALRDIEKQVGLEAQELGLPAEIAMQTGPHNILGIEINEFAAELARVTVWIGDIQWCRRNGLEISRNPILKSLEGIEHRDALMNPDGSEAAWPKVDVIVGNPPFLGGSKKRGELGDDYFNALAKAFQKDRVPPGADLVCYWFDKARIQIEQGKANMAGLVATQSVRKGSNQQVLARICATTPVFNAWSDEAWINEGAAVRVSLVCFGAGETARLDGQAVATIHADLTAGEGLDMTQARALKENAGVAFKGAEKNGAFDIPGELARQWLNQPNPNGRPNSDALRPWANGQDIVGRTSDSWVIDFGTDTDEAAASLYEMPFQYLLENVKPARERNNDPSRKKNWWRFGRTGADMRSGILSLSRFIVTSRVAKHRLFVWCDKSVSADSRLYVIARADDTSFGILHSRIHEVWALANASMHGVGNDPTYNAKSCFETFPFPPGMSPANLAPVSDEEARDMGYVPLLGTIGVDGDEKRYAPFETPTTVPCMDRELFKRRRAIARAAHALNQLRENWLNPPEWVDWVRTPEEEKAGYPLRPVAKPSHEAELKKRTLTNLYNARPAWLANAHRELDQSVAAAYGWDDYSLDMPDDEILRRLLALNLARCFITPGHPARP